MLTPEYLAKCTDYLLGLYDELDRSIIADIARRIVKTGELTPTAKHQITAAQNAGMMISEITRQVSQVSGLSQKEVKRLFEEAAITGMQNDAKPLILNGRKVDIALSEPMRQTMQAAISKTNGDLRNLTLTTGVTATGKYQDAVNAAYMKVQSGAFSYTEAIKQAIRDAASDGNCVQYASGHRDLLDVAVRRSVLTGLNQTAGKLTEMYGKDMGCEYYETSAHAGARPSHSVWQGRVFKIEGEEPGYPNFVESTGYGTGAGLCGWNCRHSFYPFFPGLSVPAYTKEKLDWYDAPRYEYNGDKLTEYEVSQLMRKCEREIRTTKREISGYKAAMDACTDETIKAELSDEYSEACVKLKDQKDKYKDICSQTNHAADNARTGVTAYKDSSGTIVSWNRSAAQTARRTAERAAKEVENKAKNAIITDKIRTVGKISPNAQIHLQPTKVDVDSLTFDNKHINGERSHGVSEEQAKQYIKNASISMTVWNGQYERYFSKDGASYVEKETKIIRTAYSSEQFSENVKNMMEELDKSGILK